MRNLIALIILVLLGYVSAYANGSKYYSEVSVSATSGEGLVYASESSATPADGDYKQTMTVSLSHKESETSTVYLFAKPLIEGQVLQYWLDANDNVIRDNSVSVKGSTDSTKPGTYSYRAVFGAPIAVKVASSNTACGTVAIDKPDNVIGDEVTVTATTVKIPGEVQNEYCKNTMVEFEGWFTEDGTCVSKEASYNFVANEYVVLTARFKTLASIKTAGYYRVRNVYGRVLGVEGSFKFDTSASPAYLEGLLHWHLPDDCVKADFANRSWNGSDDNPAVDAESMPSAVVWMEGSNLKTNVGANANVLEKVVLYGQGTDTKTLTGYTFTLKTAAENAHGYHYLYGGLSAGFKMTHYEMDEDHDFDGVNDGHFQYCRALIGRANATGPFSWMAVQPIDEEHFDTFWFGASAQESMEFDGGYWTSMYTAFPYACRDGVEAYYVKDAVLHNGVNYLQLTKVEDGVVPAKSAVLLKCQGTRSRQNRLMPLDYNTDYGTLEGNLLDGSFSLYTSATRQKDNIKPNNANYAYFVKEGRPTFTDNMRVFGVNAKGEVGFYRMAKNEDGSAQMLEPNKVYLNVNKLSEQQRTAPMRISINRLDESGVEIITDTDFDQHEPEYYTVDGMRVQTPQPGNIYIERRGTSARKVLF